VQQQEYTNFYCVSMIYIHSMPLLENPSVTMWYCEMNPHIVKVFPPSGMGMIHDLEPLQIQMELHERGR